MTEWQPIACVITREGGGWQKEERINDQGEREEREVPWGDEDRPLFTAEPCDGLVLDKATTILRRCWRSTTHRSRRCYQHRSSEPKEEES